MITRIGGELPWPSTRPDIPGLMHGWFTEKNAEMLSRFVGPQTKCIIEIGSWYGMSARWLCEHAPNADLFCIDPWEPYPEVSDNPDWAPLQPAALENFIYNLWPFRDRVHILKTYASRGIAQCAELRPDLVYIDGEHTKAAVAYEVQMARYWWPKAVLVGDDYGRDSVQSGLVHAIPAWNYINDLQDNGQCWALDVANLTPQG